MEADTSIHQCKHGEVPPWKNLTMQKVVRDTLRLTLLLVFTLQKD
jgi:hypothetical protein